MRSMVVPSLVLVAALAIPAAGQPSDPFHVTILDAGMVSQSLRITMATSGLDDHEAGRSAGAVSAWLDGVPIQAEVPLIRMPARFALDLDLAAGAVRIAGVTVGEFAPVQRFDENLIFPVEVTLRRGPYVATARRLVAIPLPTVVVPGYANELRGPDHALLAAFRRRGYRDTGPAQTVFWFAYPSLHMTFAEAAHELDAYVRQVVLPATYARKINVVGYSLGGLLARWNIAYDLDGWGGLVNRLAPGGVGVAVDVRVFVFFGSLGLGDTGGADTILGVTGESGGAVLSYGPGDGIVLVASALGLPIQGGAGVAAFAGREIQRVDLGPVGHVSLLAAEVEGCWCVCCGAEWTARTRRSTPGNTGRRRKDVLFS